MDKRTALESTCDENSGRALDISSAPKPILTLGPNGPVGSGLLSLSDAIETVADMRDREAARLRDMRRR